MCVKIPSVMVNMLNCCITGFNIKVKELLHQIKGPSARKLNFHIWGEKIGKSQIFKKYTRAPTSSPPPPHP